MLGAGTDSPRIRPVPGRSAYSRAVSEPVPIEDYAVIGDTGTAALVSRAGSVDWACLPRFDSPACFSALLGTRDHGRWLLGPAGPATSTRSYVGDSFVLATRHETATGVVEVTDLMPLGDGRADILRTVRGISGSVRLRHEWVVRFGYGKIRPWVSRRPDPSGTAEHSCGQVIVAVAGPDQLVLRGTRLPRAEDGHHVDEFEVTEGEMLEFSTTWRESHKPVPTALPVRRRVAETVARADAWAAHCDYDGPLRAAVVRSLLVLRLLTHGGTGGVVAAPTTSLPELPGGRRNWDYRFCWLRDASLTVQTLLACGYAEEVELWRDWLVRAVAGDPKDLQIVYAVDGGRDLAERTLEHLPGYAGSTPVRIGNAAVTQRQTDVLGEVMTAFDRARQEGVADTGQTWAMQRHLVDDLAEHWAEPDNGLWEIRGPLRCFTHSRVMVWAAFDRAVQGVERHGLDGPVDRWRELREAVRAEILQRGFDTGRGSFVQHYDTAEVDAALLLIPATGFLAGDDPRVLGTIRAVEQDLMHDGLLVRYRTSTGVDGLPDPEHPFLACSFWLVSAYVMAGRVADAESLMRRLLELRNDLGLLSEEYDPTNRRMAGNFPQAYSHLALVQAAVCLREAASRTPAAGKSSARPAGRGRLTPRGG